MKKLSIDLSFYSSLLSSIPEEMGYSLCRSAYSPNIKERRDYSCALFDQDGLLIAQAAHIPVHLGALPTSMNIVLQSYKKFCPGDVVVLNDPYQGGTHLPDITLVSPFFLSPAHKTPFAYFITRAHHADIGGSTPGSLPRARQIFEEGLRIPPTKLLDQGKPNQTLLQLIEYNVRTPYERKGDLNAQLAAHARGSSRLTALIERSGASQLRKKMKELLAYGQRLMEHKLAEIPDGAYSFTDALDGDGLSHQPIPIRVLLKVTRNRVTVDFTGSACACETSLNAVEAVTVSAVYYCFLCLLQTPFLDEKKQEYFEPPVNAGCLKPIRTLVPRGSVLNACAPAAVSAGNVETSQRVVDTVFGALAKAVPHIIPAASQGTMNNLTLGSYKAGETEPFAYYETIGGGLGARPNKPGIDGVQVHMTNTMNTPIEALETAYPLRIERYQIIRNSGGKGKYVGGNGIRRDIRVLTHASGSLITERRYHAPYGLNGGQPGKKGKNILIREGHSKGLPGKPS